VDKPLKQAIYSARLAAERHYCDPSGSGEQINAPSSGVVLQTEHAHQQATVNRPQPSARHSHQRAALEELEGLGG
jgi:hypothetical protein